jgi:hypothetical protein
MARNSELESGLRTMAEDFHLPAGGRMKLSRLVAEHLDWFDAAERRGMGWRDMIRAMTAAGITGRSGPPLSIGTLSSTVWRERLQAAQQADNRRGRAMPLERIDSRPRPPSEATRVSANQARDRKRTVVPHGTDHDRPRQAAPASSKRSNSGGDERSNKDVLAFMDRARSVRRRSE